MKSTSRSHTAFRPLRLAKPPTPPSPDATPQSRTAVAACRCTFLVDAFSRCTRSSAERRPTSLYLKTCDATEPRENGLIVPCVPTFSWRLRFSFFFFFILDSLIFYLFFYFFNLCSYLLFLLLFQCDVAITWSVRCAGALAWITARARFAIWRRWMLNMVI